MSTVQIKYTYHDLQTIPEDHNRYELFDGELIVTPSPSIAHQGIVSNIHLIIGNHVKQHGLGKVFTAPCDVYFDEKRTVEPDIFFVSKERSDILRERRLEGAPDLVVESHFANDRGPGPRI